MDDIAPKLGWWMIWLIALLGVILWWATSITSLVDPTWPMWLKLIGRVTGIVGFSWFALAFVLNTRWQWVEEMFGGLNKMYMAHHWLGGMSFILLLIHPVSLVFSRLYTSWPYAMSLFVPTTSWYLTLGQMALVVMQVVLIATFFGRMLYQNWKFLHQWIGLAFGLGVVHGIWQGLNLRGWSMLTVYEILMLAVVVVAYSYRTLFHQWLVKKYDYRVVGINQLNRQVLDIEIAPVGEEVSYQAGQFIFVEFPGVSREWHPFSITSAEGNLRIGVKALGDYTQKLSARLQVGMMAKIERPYGRFFERNFPKSNMVWVGGGIGITPFVGMAKSLTQETGETQLFFSVSKDNELAYGDELNLIAQEHPNFKWESWVSGIRGRLTVTDILKGNDIATTEFYICGPTEMMASLARGLVRAGASRKQIHTEMFAL
jgi:predicted ferric reductase